MLKRLFDFTFSLLLILLFFWLLILVWLIVMLNTRSNGIFLQKRVGKFGKFFTIFKFRTITFLSDNTEPHVNKISAFLRKSKLDELPQIVNVLIGNMSFVGPRPDIPGYYDTLSGDDRKILKMKPGITGPASLKYSNEEKLLSSQQNPQKYNDEVIFPDKVKINLEYQKKQSLFLDLKIIFYTILLKKDIKF